MRQINSRKRNLIWMQGDLIAMESLKWPKQAVYISFLDKETIINEDLAKQRGLCLGVADWWKTKFVYTALLALNTLTLVIKMLFILLVESRHLHMEDLVPTFRVKEGAGSE